jgi:hypothetical protein
VNRLDRETAKRRGPTRAVEPFKKKRRRNFSAVKLDQYRQLVDTNMNIHPSELLIQKNCVWILLY